jgi:hypothetical protein
MQSNHILLLVLGWAALGFALIPGIELGFGIARRRIPMTRGGRLLFLSLAVMFIGLGLFVRYSG